MPPSKFRFAFGSESKDPGVLCQNFDSEHMRHDCGAISFRDGVDDVSEPDINVLSLSETLSD